MFTIDGISYNILVPVGSLRRTFEIKEGGNSALLLSGEYDRDIIGTYYNYEMNIDARNSAPEQYDLLYQALTAPVPYHIVTFPYGQSTLTFNAYITGGSDGFRRKLGTKQYWGELTVTFHAQAPQRS